MKSFKITTKEKISKPNTTWVQGKTEVSKLLPLNKHKSTDSIILIQQFYIDSLV